MKTLVKLELLVIAAILVISATPRGVELRKSRSNHNYTRQDVAFLMNSNGWTRDQATSVLELAAQYPVRPE